MLAVVGSTFSQQAFIQKELSINKHIDGTLLVPEDEDYPILAIIIAGSGPTDRDGNQNLLKNNSLKKLAETLSSNGIATFRYDKRIVKQIRINDVDDDIMFDDFVSDAESVLEFFSESGAFRSVVLVGHSQGSLVAMLASPQGADGVISLAGAGKTIDEVIIDQIQNMAPGLVEDTTKTFDVLKQGKTTDDFPPALASIFNKGVQPFISNWMQYDPSEIIQDLDMPILIINGTKDLQVSEEEAKLLKQAKPDAELVIIEKMNHILVPIEGDDLENSKSYNEAYRKISPELISSILSFLEQF